jgi:hypothetical protein
MKYAASKFRSMNLAAMIVGIVALVMASTGGAFAAQHYLITSSSQVKNGSLGTQDFSKRAIRQLKGATVTLPGAAGQNGQAGANGSPGAKGDAGSNGAGTNGQDGLIGPTGKDGATGPIGPIGLDGAAGPKGDTGAAGADGSNGAKGDTGAAGPKGETGAASTVPGPQGPKGDKGDTGAKGADAKVMWATVAADGTLVAGSGVVSVTKDGMGWTFGADGTYGLSYGVEFSDLVHDGDLPLGAINVTLAGTGQQHFALAQANYPTWGGSTVGVQFRAADVAGAAGTYGNTKRAFTITFTPTPTPIA